MKKQINPTIKAHLIRSAFYVLLLVAVCVIPFALAQRSTSNKNTASKNAGSKNVIKGAANRVAPARTTFGLNDPRAKGTSKSASSTRFSNARGIVPHPAANAPAGVACWYDLTPGAAPFVPGVDDIGNHTDDGDTFISLPFTVNLYGGSFTSALAGSNGQLSFGTDYTSFVITCPPPFGGNGSTDMLAPYWGDQCTNTAGCGGGESCAGCGIFTTTTGSSPNRVFYIEWRTQYYNQSTPLLDYEVALYENGTPPFSIIYSNISAAGAPNDSQLVVGNKFNETCYTVFGCDTTGGTSPPVSSGQAYDAVAAATPTPTAPPACSPWANANPYPTTIVRYGFVQTATDFYVFGGVSDGTQVNNVNSYNIASGTWTPLSPMPFTSEAPTCSLDASTGIVYCAQGDTGNGFASYNIATDTWTTLASDPFATDHYGSASGTFNGKVFVAGGTTGETANVDVYDIGTDTWSPGTAAPDVFLLAGYQQVGNFLYVVGGWNFGSPGANKTTTYRLDMTSAPGTWDTGPTFTEARSDFGLAYDASQNKLYAMGGDADGGGFFDSTNLVDELDVSGWPGGTWTSSTPNLPAPNRQANQAGFYGGGNIWSVGGLDGSTFIFSSEVLFRPSCAGGGGPCTLQPWQIVAPYSVTSESVSVSTDGTFAYAAGGFDGTIGGPTNSFNQYDPVADTWTALPNVPGAFYDAPSVYAANTNRVYVFGGIDATFTPSNVVQVYDVGSNTWVANGAPMPGPRYFASAAYYDANGKIYVISGFDGSFLETTTTWEYDPVADTWDTSRLDMPVPTGGAGYSIVGQNIYLAGTWNGGSGSTQHYTYDIVANTWTAVAPVPVNIYRPASGSIGTNEYLVGGGNPFLAPGSKLQKQRKGVQHPSTRSPATSYNTTYVYDTLSDSWSNGPNTNVAHGFTGGTAVGNDLLVVTGFDGVSGDTNTVEKSHCGAGGGTPTPTPTPTGSCVPEPWQEVAAMTTDLYGAAGGSDGTNFYAAGGYSFSQGITLDILQKYDGTSWTTLSPMPQAQIEGCGVYYPVNNTFYVFGGEDAVSGTNYNLTQIYDIGSDTWSMGANMPDVHSFAACGYVPATGKIYVLSGYNSGQVTDAQPNTWEYDPVADTWTDLTGSVPFPHPAGGFAYGVINDKVYVAGGRDAANLVINNTWEFDPTVPAYTAKTDEPGTFQNNVPGSAAAQNLLWVFGGGNPFVGGAAEAKAGIAAPSSAHVVEAKSSFPLELVKRLFGHKSNVPDTDNSGRFYDPSTDTWTASPNMNELRSFSTGGAITNSLIIAAGGYNGSTTVASAETEIVCAGGGTPTPTPTATPTPTPVVTPTPTPVVTPTPTPVVTPTPTPVVTPTPTPLERSPTPRPRPTPFPRPTPP